MKTLKTTQDYIENVEQSNGLKAVVFTQFNAPCSRCDVAKKTLRNIKKPAIPIFEFSTPLNTYPVNALNINAVPTLVIFKDNKEISRVSGFSEDRIPKFYKDSIHKNY